MCAIVEWNLVEINMSYPFWRKGVVFYSHAGPLTHSRARANNESVPSAWLESVDEAEERIWKKFEVQRD